MATKNLELFFLHKPTENLITLANVDATGIENGVIIPVSSEGFFSFQTPAQHAPDGIDIISSNVDGVWVRRTPSLLKTYLTELTVDTVVNINSFTHGVRYSYLNTGSNIITLTFIGGANITNPPELNGSATTIGFNPKDFFTIIKDASNNVLII